MAEHVAIELHKQRLQKRCEEAGHQRSLGPLSHTETDDRTDLQKGGLSSTLVPLRNHQGGSIFS
jgi:hypothetical protein